MRIQASMDLAEEREILTSMGLAEREILAIAWTDPPGATTTSWVILILTIFTV